MHGLERHDSRFGIREFSAHEKVAYSKSRKAQIISYFLWLMQLHDLANGLRALIELDRTSDGYEIIATLNA